GAFSALLTARAAFEARQSLAAEIEALRRRLDQRQTVVRAVAMMMSLGKTEDEAYGQLRRMAMAWRISFEAAAERLVAAQGGPRARDAADDCRRRPCASPRDGAVPAAAAQARASRHRDHPRRHAQRGLRPLARALFARRTAFRRADDRRRAACPERHLSFRHR